MRHVLDDSRVSVQYHTQDLYIRLRHSASTDPLVFYSRILIATLLLTLILSLSFSAVRARNDTSQTINTTVTDLPSDNDHYQPTVSGGITDPAMELSGELHQVVSVTDGDTIKVDIDGVIEAIRVIGLDAPETNHPNKPAGCFGSESSAKLKSLIGSKKVNLESDPTQDNRDKYGRLLRHVHTPDGINVAYEMIKDGYAREYTYDLPYKYQSQFRQAEQQAKTSNSGFWAPGACSNPTAESSSGTHPVPFGAAPVPNTPSTNVYYRNCTAARQAGAAPVYIGEPGYGAHLDRDRDGIGCE